MTKIQKKKILYSFLAVGVIFALAITSWLLWSSLNGNDWDTIKGKIVTGITTYLSLFFLAFKVVWFFVSELKAKKARLQEIKEIFEIKKDKNMAKKANTSNLKQFEKTFETDNFSYKIKGSKTIEITTKDNANFSSIEDFYKKIRSENGQFMELFRKYLSGQIE